ncbi:hypothetical protein BCT86_14425 [Vibrio breoganii]|uniref:hypothetical protein n=1 Tax=Vibrio breoganii TaxID=553239 RepID=UPI000C861BA8|nr:hypothetical protein [Vibrio breoganii]PML04917.1 hypothetical protein BCT86_14425 [Vibrio breoganii]
MKITIPESLLEGTNLGGSVKGRLKTTFSLIPEDDKFSSKALDNKLKKIRDNFTKSLGNKEGRVILKQNKSIFEERINELKKDIAIHTEQMEKGLSSTISSSIEDITNYYLPIVLENKPDKLLGSLGVNSSTEDIKKWLFNELESHTPTASSLIKGITLDIKYKDVTYETLKRESFIEEIKKHFPNFNWNSAHSEFVAAKGQKR